MRGFIILAIFFFCFQSSFAQTYYRSQVNFEIGHFMPSKQSYRNNYEQNLVTIEYLKSPLTIGIGYQYSLLDQKAIYFQTRYQRNQLKANESTVLSTIPIILGFRYYLPSNIISVPRTQLLVGAGIGYYISVFKTNYAIGDETGAFIQNKKGTKIYNGIGFNLEAALEYKIKASWAVKFLLNYDITRVSKTSVGGLGNIGGLLAACKVMFCF